MSIYDHLMGNSWAAESVYRVFLQKIEFLKYEFLIFYIFLYEQKRFRSFKRGTVSLNRSKGCKITSCQSWRSEKNPATRPDSNQTRVARVRVLDDQIIFKVWQATTLQPFDLQRLTVPLLKDLNLFCWHIVWPRD